MGGSALIEKLDCAWGRFPMQRNIGLEVMFPLIRLKHRLIESTRSPQFAMRPDPQYESWRAMQTAYNKYLYASEELDVAGPEMTSPTILAMLVTDQRRAFERYIEARLEYSEFHRDQPVDPAAVSNDKPFSHNTSGLEVQLANAILETTQTFINITRDEKNMAHAVRSVEHVRLGLRRVRMIVAAIPPADRENVYERLERLEKSAALLAHGVLHPSSAEESVLEWPVWDSYGQRAWSCAS
jgi:hypothetical protein